MSLLAKGYAGGICFIIGSKNNLTKTYFMQAIAGLCPNKIYEENSKSIDEQLFELFNITDKSEINYIIKKVDNNKPLKK